MGRITVQVFVFLLILTPFIALSQTGMIKGRITNKINNEPIMFASVLVEGTNRGTTTDEEGYYEIDGLEPGLYNVRATYIGFNEATIYEVQVTTARPEIVNIEMEETIETLQEVVIKSSPFRKTEESPVPCAPSAWPRSSATRAATATSPGWSSPCPA